MTVSRIFAYMEIARFNIRCGLFSGILFLSVFIGFGCVAEAEAQDRSDETSLESALQSPFLQAIAKGNIWFVEAMLKNGHPPNVREESKIEETPILFAVKLGNFDITRILLDNGANLEAANEVGVNSLLLACYTRNTQMVKFLLSKGAKVNRAANCNTTALMISSNLGDMQTLEILLLGKAEVGAKTCRGATALMLAADNEQVVEVLVKAGQNINDVDGEGWTALFHAVLNRQSKKLSTLLKLGANDKVIDRLGRTPIMVASGDNDAKVREQIRKILTAPRSVNK